MTFVPERYREGLVGPDPVGDSVDETVGCRLGSRQLAERLFGLGHVLVLGGSVITIRGHRGAPGDDEQAGPRLVTGRLVDCAGHREKHL